MAASERREDFLRAKNLVAAVAIVRFLSGASGIGAAEGAGIDLAHPVPVMWLSIKLLDTGVLRLKIGGQLDVTTIPDLEPMLDSLVAREPWQVELELSRLRMIDGIGVRALVRFHRRLHARGCLVTVTGLREQPLTVFRLFRLEHQLGDIDLAPRWS
jgi:anti-sigma B factor antagonist